ncbi:MAG TPA: type II toxin-antitoxin system RelE/ParE family toxin [Cyanobacteria bacterium UBA8803]|nr:type II toxin-antitoxin system RelE/ParE family toxin [Cyanobacteria bacterium UBA9273]HBL60522.1 type II toxin-antitoxin system RelE/ParE family toxin [Cyanobacteria bacterium UBA8803]
MAYHVEISPTAISDIEATFLWLRERSPEIANKWVNSCSEAMLSLEQFPERCQLAPESKLMGIEIRQLLHQNKYRILFTITLDTTETEGVVQIHRVMHSARDRLRTPEGLLGEDSN